MSRLRPVLGFAALIVCSGVILWTSLSRPTRAPGMTAGVTAIEPAAPDIKTGTEFAVTQAVLDAASQDWLRAGVPSDEIALAGEVMRKVIWGYLLNDYDLFAHPFSNAEILVSNDAGRAYLTDFYRAMFPDISDEQWAAKAPSALARMVWKDAERRKARWRGVDPSRVQGGNTFVIKPEEHGGAFAGKLTMFDVPSLRETVARASSGELPTLTLTTPVTFEDGRTFRVRITLIKHPALRQWLPMQIGYMGTTSSAPMLF